jgi:hydrogenase/urease accessory protein HupE
MRPVATILVAAFVVLGAQTSTRAHELRPAYLEITQSAPEDFDVLWKVPARGEFRLSLQVELPDVCEDATPRIATNVDAASITRWQVHCRGGLADRQIAIDGLSVTYTDVLVRIVRIDGTVQTTRLTPDAPDMLVAAAPSTTDTARTYFTLGVQHILLGVDHLLFVLALLLLIRGTWVLVETITAFTVAHSITLAFAALGLAQAPQAPVEAVVALSIVFVAAEIIRTSRGQFDLTSRYPWVIAFLFGLLHGFGFGGALREIGLPQKDVPMALVTFNLGVEAGQLLFVGLALAAIGSTRLLVGPGTDRPRLWASYSIGSVAAVWFVQRLAGF